MEIPTAHLPNPDVNLLIQQLNQGLDIQIAEAKQCSIHAAGDRDIQQKMAQKVVQVKVMSNIHSNSRSSMFMVFLQASCLVS